MWSRGLALLLAASLGLLAGRVQAQSPPDRSGEASPFVGREIAVDVTSASAAQAREQAIADAERRAVQQVLERLTLPADHARLPRPVGAALQALIEGMEVHGERVSATRYIARIDVAFRRAGIRALLRQAGIPFAETRAQPALLLPLLERERQLLLFEGDNPWAAAWAELPLLAGLRPMLLPSADAEPATLPPADRARLSSVETWRPLAARLGADSVILADAKLLEDAGGSVLDLTLHALDGAQDTTIVRRLQAAAGTPAADLLRQAATAALSELEEQWKRSILLNFEQRGQLLVEAALGGLADLVTLRRTMQQTAAIRRVEILSLTRRQAQLLLQVLGEPAQLALALAQRGIELRQEGEAWRMAVRQPTSPK